MLLGLGQYYYLLYIIRPKAVSEVDVTIVSSDCKNPLFGQPLRGLVAPLGPPAKPRSNPMWHSVLSSSGRSWENFLRAHVNQLDAFLNVYTHIASSELYGDHWKWRVGKRRGNNVIKMLISR